jgi:hypothetical protein
MNSEESKNAQTAAPAPAPAPQAQPAAQPAAPAQPAQPAAPAQPAQPVAEAKPAEPVKEAAQPATPAPAQATATTTEAAPAPAAQPAQPAPQPQPVPQPASEPAPQPETLPQTVETPAPAPTPVAQPVAEAKPAEPAKEAAQPATPAPAPAATTTTEAAPAAAQPAQTAAPAQPAPPAQPATPAAPAAEATPAVQDIKPAAALNPLANEQAADGSGVIAPSTLNSYDNANIGFVPVGEAVSKKKNKGVKWAIIAVVIIALGLLGYFVVYPYVYRTYFANPKNVYDAVVKESFKKMSTNVTELRHMRDIYDLQFSFDSNIESLQDFIGYTYGVNIGADPDEKSIQTGITVKGKDNVEHSYYSYIKDKKEYLRLSSYRELIYVGEANMNKSSILQLPYQSILDTAYKANGTNLNYLITKMGDLVAGSISADKLIKEDASITINGNVTKVINNKYIINNQVISDSLAYIKDGILKDDKTLDILVEMTGMEKDQVKRQIEEMNTKVTPLKSDQTITISIFTAGLKNEIVGFEITNNKNEGNIHYYTKDGFFEIKGHTLVKDEETGKEISHNLLVIGNKVEGKTKVNVKYNDEEVANLVLNVWDEKARDVDYDVKLGGKNYKGNIKYVKDISQEKGKHEFSFSINVGKEYIRFDINLDNNWTTDVSNIMIGSAKTLTEDEISQKEQEFVQTLQNTPIYKLFSTTDGNFDKSILDYYNNGSKKVEPENPVTDDPALQDICFKLDASGNYNDETTTCSNYICTVTVNGVESKKQCNVA